MKVALALIAEYALAHPDGRLYITGGGIRTLPFSAFPAKQPRLSLALGIEFLPEEVGRAHAMTIEFVGPEKEQLLRPFEAFLTVPPDIERDAPPYLHFVYNMENIALPAKGEHSFKVVIDGEDKCTVPLTVVETPGTKSPDIEAAILLTDGHRAFSQGDAATAEKLFRAAIDRLAPQNPSGLLAVAHNNLGFVLLPKDALEAKRELQRANELGYEQPEINDANLACAGYLLGEFGEALALFQRCLRSRGFEGFALLYGISEEELFPVPLRSASDYVALISLDAAWSAFRAGDSISAAHYRAGAEASELARREDPFGERFAEAIKSLGRAL